MFVNFRHGGTLQQKVLHLVFENAVQNLARLAYVGMLTLLEGNEFRLGKRNLVIPRVNNDLAQHRDHQRCFTQLW